MDVATGWTECLALLRRSEADVIGALNSVRQRLPVALLGLDTDNGSEFINYEMLRYCQREQITFTRSRVNKRNDQAYVEEKNGSVVRRLIGYDRYEGVDAWRALMQLYEVLRHYLNLFQPSMKLLSKKRDGARVSKRYDQAQPPCQRVLASTQVRKRNKEELRRLFRELDPLVLTSINTITFVASATPPDSRRDNESMPGHRRGGATPKTGRPAATLWADGGCRRSLRRSLSTIAGHRLLLAP